MWALLAALILWSALSAAWGVLRFVHNPQVAALVGIATFMAWGFVIGWLDMNRSRK